MKVCKNSLKIVERRYSWESRGYDKDSVERSYGTMYDVFRGKELLQSFFSKGSATEYLNLQLPKGKAMYKKILTNDKKVKNLESKIKAIEEESFKLHKKLQKGLLSS